MIFILQSKSDWQQCFKKIVSPLKPFFTDGKAGIKCGATGATYSEKTALLEAFARPLWGFAPFWSGGGEDNDFEKLYLEGIRNGTNPNHPEYWGEIVDYDQKIVETAPIGLSLIMAPKKVWYPLSEIEKDRLYEWLSQVNKVKSVDNNWLFFAVLVNLAFKTVGREYDKDIINHAISRFDDFYKGNGWYSDGNTRQTDYYISFAIHFYSLIYAKVMEKDDPKNSQKFKKRAELFAKDFIYWFDESGSALAFGRSLTYRFAQCCFWSACVYSEVKPFSIGIIKGIISRNIEQWLSKPIFDNANILTIGYSYPNLNMSECYNAFGSPYWALKSFLILALDKEHEFFKVKPQPLPKLDRLHIIPEANMVIQRVNGYAVALTSGQWAEFNPVHTAEKYSKFAYSSKYAFSVPRSYYRLGNCGGDSMLVFVKNDFCFVRRECKNVEITQDGIIKSDWSPLKGISVHTELIPTDNGHKRVHTVFCEEDITAYDCGFALPNEACDISGEGETILIKSVPNTNLINPNTFINAVKYNFKKGKNRITTTVVYPE